MSSDEYLRAGVDARRDRLTRSAAGRRPTTGRLADLHLRLWWATRPRRRLTCLVTFPSGAAVLGDTRR